MESSWSSAAPAIAGERYALLVTGASGGPEFAKKYHDWRVSFASTLREKLARYGIRAGASEPISEPHPV